MKFYLKNWSAVAPGVWGKEGLQKLHQISDTDQEEIQFRLDFVTPTQRRRLSYTTRLALQAAILTAPKEILSRLSTVFVSRHGEMANTVKVLAELKNDEMPSPTKFIHSVHGTAAGIFSILLNNTQPSITIASKDDELTPALFEVASIFDSGETSELLVIFFDTPAVGQYRDYLCQPKFSYSVALYFHRLEGETALELVDAGTPGENSSIPQSLSFLTWLQTEEPAFPLFGSGGWQINRI